MAKRLVGTVTSDVQDKTVTVMVTRRQTHPIYKKQYTVSKKFAVHDEINEAHIGDRVEISETKPVSKRKSWKIERIIETGHAVIELKEEKEAAAKPAGGEV